VRPVSLGAALGDVAVEQVQAPGVAQVADLGEQAQDRHGWVLGPAGAQVIAIRTGQRGPVLRRADQPLRLGGAGVPLDRVQ
jgi:hypothetical protein